MEKLKHKTVSTCRDPRDFSNPLIIIKELISKLEEKDKTKPPKLDKKIIY